MSERLVWYPSPQAQSGANGEGVPTRPDGLEPAAWQVPYARLRQLLRKMKRRLKATRNVVQLRERFAASGWIESPEQLRFLRAEKPVDGWITQALNCFCRAVDVLKEVQATEPETPQAQWERDCRITGGALDIAALGREFLELNARLKQLAEYSAEWDLFAGVVLPATEPESAKIRRRRAAAAVTPIISRRQRRRLLKSAVIVRRVMRGRPPPPLFSPSH